MSESEQAAAENGKSAKPSAKAAEASKPKGARKSGKAGRAGKKTSPGARARASREKLAEMAGKLPAKSITHPLRARVRERLADLGSDDSQVRCDARVLLCWEVQADGEYISKVTPKEIADAIAAELGTDHPGAVKWTTVEQDGCEAERHRRRMTKHPEEIARYQMRAERHAKRVMLFAEEQLEELGAIEATTPLDAKLKTEAGAKALEVVEKVIEREGRMFGELSSGSTVNISISQVMNASIPIQDIGDFKVEVLAGIVDRLYRALPKVADEPTRAMLRSVIGGEEASHGTNG